MNNPSAFKIASSIRSRLHTIFAQIDHVPAQDLELMSQLVRDHRLPAGWLDRAIRQAKASTIDSVWSAS